MKKIDKDELFEHVSQFLKIKGVELQEGSYTRTIQKGCQVLADTVNLSQQAMERAKSGIERKLDQARQVIHEKTAPRKPPVQPQPQPQTQAQSEPPPADKTETPKPVARKRRATKSKPGKRTK